ncbi:hypothetical protein, partial [Mesorhizobium sp. M5C.F.Ca.ET.164.01.1.1]|uniref:hypothetical protein n=1 Tax=Mesorhizobium sp. M5C.F.Ca.ET.164.01.1.1 TaxID=2563957 RepID=UPI001093C5AE
MVAAIMRSCALGWDFDVLHNFFKACTNFLHFFCKNASGVFGFKPPPFSAMVLNRAERQPTGNIRLMSNATPVRYKVAEAAKSAGVSASTLR